LDDRTLVPSGLPVNALETKSSIPANLPLEAIAERFVVPRDINPEAYQVEEKFGLPPQPSEMDERVIIPLGAASPEIIPPPAPVSPELVEKDIFTTGEVNFLGDEELVKKQTRQNRLDRIYSVVVHVAIILLLVFPPKFLRRRPPSAEDQEIARKQMTLLLPPGAFELSRPEPRSVPPPPAVKVDPRILRKIAPPEPEPLPAPQPTVQPKLEARELPAAPLPKPNAEAPPSSPAPKTDAPPNSAPKLETPDAPKTQPNLVLPKSSGNPLRDTLHDMSRNSASGGKSGGFSAPTSRAPVGSGGRMGGGDTPGGGMNGAYQILTPTEGVDFSDYMAGAGQCSSQLVCGDARVRTIRRPRPRGARIQHPPGRQRAQRRSAAAPRFGQGTARPRRGFRDSLVESLRPFAAGVLRPGNSFALYFPVQFASRRRQSAIAFERCR
jgi:hypothetical protein